MRMRLGALLLMASASLLAQVQSASASHCGAAKYGSCSSPCSDAQTCFTSCQQQCKPTYKIVYDNVIEKRWHTTYKTVHETVMKPVKKTCYREECRTEMKTCHETCYKTVQQEVCKPCYKTCYKEV